MTKLKLSFSILTYFLGLEDRAVVFGGGGEKRGRMGGGGLFKECPIMATLIISDSDYQRIFIDPRTSPISRYSP